MLVVPEVSDHSQSANTGWLDAPDTKRDRREKVVAHLINQFKRT
jgi:hypothetical protein